MFPRGKNALVNGNFTDMAISQNDAKSCKHSRNAPLHIENYLAINIL
jgi:hypothetical protein